MELGEKILQARLERGISQRQLCGDIITRNMLSRIEHGAARPSMDTLRYLALQLGLPMSYFLEEDALSSPNQQALLSARQAFRQKNWAGLKEALGQFQSPDPVFQPEWELLQFESLLEQARQALQVNQNIYARELLGATQELEQGLYISRELRTRRSLLLARAGVAASELSGQLPCLDELLLLQSQAESQPRRQLDLLAAVEDTHAPAYSLLLGKAHYALGDYTAACQALIHAEEAYPREAVPLLEVCFRELGDFRRAYEYACRQR